MGIGTSLLLLGLTFGAAYLFQKIEEKCKPTEEEKKAYEREKHYDDWCFEFDRMNKMSEAQRRWHYRHRND